MKRPGRTKHMEDHFSVEIDSFSTSHSSGNQVDGSPLVFSTAAVLVGLRLGPRRSMNLGGKNCIVGYVCLSVSSFGIFKSSFYVLNLF